MKNKTFQDRVIKSAIAIIKKKNGSYSKPSEIRALFRDKNYYITKRGAVRKVTQYD